VLASLRSLRSKNFAVIWSSALVSNVGSWMQTVALGVVVTTRSHNPLWTGAVAAAAFVPVGVLSPVGGALADRLDRRRWLIITTLAEAGFAALLAVLAATGHAPSWALVVMAFLGGVAAAVGFPTYQAMIPDLVPADDLLGAVSLSSAQYNLGRVIGPALAGVVLLTGSAAWVFTINAASFGAVVAALCVLRLPTRASHPDDGARILRRIVEGARVAASEPGCRSAIVLISIVALIGSPFIALVPAMAITALDSGAKGTSVLLTAQGIGAVGCAVFLASLVLAFGRRLLVVALVAFPLALVCYGLAPSLWSAALAIAGVGACYMGVLTGLNTVVQRRAPSEARGRVLGLYMMALGVLYPVGAVIEGAIAHAVGIRDVTVVSGLVLFAVMVAVGVLRRDLFAALEDPPTGSEARVDLVPRVTTVKLDPGTPAAL
jgi:MFS family permease